jgi:hypothetical protein
MSIVVLAGRHRFGGGVLRDCEVDNKLTSRQREPAFFLA